MVNLSCKYLGLELRNPIIAVSSGLTSSLDNLKTIVHIGAVVLKHNPADYERVPFLPLFSNIS